MNHALREWYNKQSSVAKQGLHSNQITGLMNTIDRNKLFDDGELVKKVIHAVTDIYLDSWNDTTIEEYLDTLQQVKEQIILTWYLWREACCTIFMILMSLCV